MNSLQGFQSFLSAQSAQIPVFTFSINLLLAALLSSILGKMYIRYGNALSDRIRFSSNFIILALTTTLIITIVKSSLALSLGLVGALSIVRFRAAIKEPEELSYLFLVIAIGLGLGANQQLITIIGFLVSIAVIRAVSIAKIQKEDHNLFINIAGQHQSRQIELGAIADILARHCSSVRLRRSDIAKEGFEASFLVEIDDFEKLKQTKKELLALSDSLRITVMDNRGIA